jgi:hypothetical protein
MMKRQKLIAILFCCALLIGVSSVTASAQESTIAGTTYRLSIYPYGLPGFNADASFLENGVLLIGIGDGSGSYFESAPAFVGSYSALSVELGDETGNLSMYIIGTTSNEGQSIFGLGFSFFKVEDTNNGPYYFFFTGKLIP